MNFDDELVDEYSMVSKLPSFKKDLCSSETFAFKPDLCCQKRLCCSRRCCREILRVQIDLCSWDLSVSCSSLCGTCMRQIEIERDRDRQRQIDEWGGRHRDRLQTTLPERKPELLPLPPWQAVERRRRGLDAHWTGPLSPNARRQPKPRSIPRVPHRDPWILTGS